MEKRKKKFSIEERLKSFRYAANGLRLLVEQEHNARIHAVVTIMVLALGVVLDFDSTEWVAVLIVISVVLITETLNTAIERLCDLFFPEYNQAVKEIKDLAAGAVLIASAVAVIVGLIVLCLIFRYCFDFYSSLVLFLFFKSYRQPLIYKCHQYFKVAPKSDVNFAASSLSY